MNGNIHSLEERRIHSLELKRQEKEILNYPCVKSLSLLHSASKGELIQVVYSLATDCARWGFPDTEREEMIESCELDGGFCKKWLLEEWEGMQKGYEELGDTFIVNCLERLNNRECSPSTIDEG